MPRTEESCGTLVTLPALEGWVEHTSSFGMHRDIYCWGPVWSQHGARVLTRQRDEGSALHGGIFIHSHYSFLRSLLESLGVPRRNHS